MSRTALRWRPSRQAVALMASAVVAVGVALAVREVELLAVATPPLWALLTTRRTPEPAVAEIGGAAGQLPGQEGSPVEVALSVQLDGVVEHARAELAVPTCLSGRLVASGSQIARLDLAGDLLPVRWGRHRLGPLRLELLSSTGLRSAAVDIPLDLDCRVVPRPSRVRAASAPRLLPNRLGEHVTRAAGHGTEPVGVRPYAPGDVVRRINWRVSSRRQALHVTVAAAERAVDVVLVLDAMSDVGEPPDASLDRTVRTASGLAVRWLRERDRVGLVVLGGALRWLTPASGRVQQQRIAESVLWAWSPPGEVPPDVARVPRAALPPGSVVVVLSPLLEDRALAAVAALRVRSRHLVIIDVLGDAAPEVDPHDATGQLAARLWRLERQATIERLRRTGTPVLQPGAGDLDRLLDLALRAAR